MKTLNGFLLTLLLTLALLVPDAELHGQRSLVFNPNSGYINITELTGAIGLAETNIPYSKFYFGITNINGYQLSFRNNMVDKRLQGGVGLGAYFYNEGTLFPVFLDFRFVWEIQELAPYFYADGGGLISFKEFGSYSRLFVNPGLGVRYAFTESLAAQLGIGLHVQSGGSDHAHDSFINFKMGLVFKPN